MNRIQTLLLIVAVSCSGPSNTDQARWERQAAGIEIIRDHFGVPHVYGKTDADAVFGLMYAQCEDDFNRVEQNYIWAIGRLAEIEGEEALYSDLRARLFMTQEEAIQQYDESPVWLKQLCVAFADGINYFLYTHPSVKPRLISHFEPWMPFYFSEGSIGGDIEGISTDGIRDFYDPDTVQGKRLSESSNKIQQEPSGSNGFAIAGSLTASGDAMLLINPHTSFFFRGEVHMVSDEGLNAYGAVTWGQFFIYQGFNEQCGWMHTSTYTDRVDEFAETIIKTPEGLYYQYGQDTLTVETRRVTLSYSAGDTLKRRDFRVYRTHHGPVTQRSGEKWIATAMLWEPAKALEQSFVRTKATNHRSFKAMLDLRTNATNNTVYADADGTIAYYHGNFIPKKSPRFDYSQPVDGSDPETDWKGRHTVEECIQVVNPPIGWIQNCNSTPFTSAGKYSPRSEDYPSYMTRNEENYRGVHAIRLLQRADSLTLDKLINLAYDPYLPAFEILIPGLLQAHVEHPADDADVAQAMEELRTWDFKASAESVGMSLAHFYGMRCLRDIVVGDGLTFMERIQYFANQVTPELRREIFSRTVKQLGDDFGTWRTPWGEINRYQRITGDIRQPFDDTSPSISIGMGSGRWGALASFGAQTAAGTKRIYGTSGNSFVAVVEFGDRVRAKSLLAGGQSGDPDSPHFDDQAQRYADVMFKDVLFYRPDVLQNAEATYHPGAQVD